MEREKVILQFLGKKLLSFKKLETGEVIGTGLLNPIFNKFKFTIRACIFLTHIDPFI